MKSRAIDLIKMICFGIIVSGICTFILYYFFPQYLCYTVYDVSRSSLWQNEKRDVDPGTLLTEYFTPQYDFLTGISIQLQREESEDLIVGRLFDDRQRLLAEDQFTLQDSSYEFLFNKWVTPGEAYRLDILIPKENDDPIITTFGLADGGTPEHISLYIDDVQVQDALYIEYIYGAYSRKLLAFWSLIFFLSGLMIWETAQSKRCKALILR